MWTGLKRTGAALLALLALWGVARELGRKREAQARARRHEQRESRVHAERAAVEGEKRRRAIEAGQAAEARIARELEALGEREPDLGALMERYNGRRE